MRPSRPLAVAASVVAALVLAACTGGSADRPASSAGASGSGSGTAGPSAPPTPLAAYDSTGVAVLRGDLCPLVPASDVARALGGAGTASSYGEGDLVELAPGLRDRSGEYACSWRAGDGTTARAWVFAPPVPRARARDLARGVAAQPGCRRLSGPAFGDPTVATVCRAGQVRTASYAGLFVDAWLSCSVGGSAAASLPDLRRRAGEWCVAVASAATIS